MVAISELQDPALTLNLTEEAIFGSDSPARQIDERAVRGRRREWYHRTDRGHSHSIFGTNGSGKRYSKEAASCRRLDYLARGPC